MSELSNRRQQTPAEGPRAEGAGAVLGQMQTWRRGEAFWPDVAGKIAE
jgi:hypothetical protein